MGAIEHLHLPTDEPDAIVWARSLVYDDRIDNKELGLLIHERPSLVADVIAGVGRDRTVRDRIVRKLAHLMESGALNIADSDIHTAGELVERRAVNVEETNPIEFFRQLHGQGWSFAQIGRETGYDGTVISRVFGEKYPGDMDAVREAFQAAQARILGPSRGALVWTRTAELVQEMLNEVRATQFLTVFVGRSGIGKTEAIARYQRRPGAPPILLHTITSTETVSTFLRSLAGQLEIPSSVNVSHLPGAIIEAMKQARFPRLIVLDEVNMLRPRPTQACKILNAVRLINDQVRGGVALLGTVNLFDLVYDPRHQAEVDMIRTRVSLAVRLPEPNDREMAALLHAHIGAITDQVWLAFREGLDAYGAEERSSMRRVAMFLHHLRRIREINSVKGSVNAQQVKAVWRRMRNF
ncbi:MAG: AAA family ATPase [Alphaproteobacteria bacterium]|nr:AAA family ATPase [Alphaproteobacteria bacterium]